MIVYNILIRNYETFYKKDILNKNCPPSLNLLLENIGKYILGSKYILATAEPEHILGRFHSMDRKLITIYDEADGNICHKQANKIKSFITADTIVHEEKGIKALILNNYQRMFFCTNNDNTLKNELNDRRNQIIECINEKLPEENVNKIIDGFKNRQQLAYFIRFVEKRDISKFNTEKHRVKTDLYFAMASTNISFYDKFIINLLNSNGRILSQKKGGIPAMRLFNLYDNYTTSHNKSVPTSTQFGLKMKNYNSLNKKKTGKGNVYTFNFLELSKELLDKKLIDKDEYDYMVLENKDEDNIVNDDEDVLSMGIDKSGEGW